MSQSRTSRISISDVAAEADVSIGTVSNVLNSPSKVNDATANRVKEAIARLGYVRNGIASQLRAGKRTTVGAIVFDLANPFFSSMVKGIESALEERGFTLMVSNSYGEFEREERCLRRFEEQSVAAVLAVPSNDDLSALHALSRRGIPVILLDAESPDVPLSSVAVDNAAGGSAAVGHLLDTGASRVHVMTASVQVHQTRERLAGAEQACRDRGLDPDETLISITASELTSAGAEEAMSSWLDRSGSVPQAVFAMNDLMAIGVQRALRRRHSYDPSRTALVGYDDIDFARELMVPLSSVWQPANELGRQATDLLLHPDDTPRRILFSPKLVVRESSSGIRAASDTRHLL